jgi:hypothetical protein
VYRREYERRESCPVRHAITGAKGASRSCNSDIGDDFTDC